MSKPTNPSPLTKQQVVDMYFLEHRSKLIDIAAFLDRVDRAPRDHGSATGNTTATDADPTGDHRLAALRKAISTLAGDRPQRVDRILEQLSDPTTTPTDTPGPPANGAYP